MAIEIMTVKIINHLFSGPGTAMFLICCSTAEAGRHICSISLMILFNNGYNSISLPIGIHKRGIVTIFIFLTIFHFLK